MKKLHLLTLSIITLYSLTGCQLDDFLSILDESNLSNSIDSSNSDDLNIDQNKLEIDIISNDIDLQYQYLNNIDYFSFTENENLTVSIKILSNDQSVIKNKIKSVNFEAYTHNDNSLTSIDFDGKYRVNGQIQKDQYGNDLTLLQLPIINKEYEFTTNTIEKIDFTFAWGSAFNYLNPYVNNQVDDLNNKINALNQLINNTFFKITLEYVSNSNETGENIVDNITYKQLRINFLQLGNATTGDSTYIKAGDTDILIDAGCKQASAETIIEFIDQYCSDGKLEYVITTHAHEDHWSGMFGRSKTENGSSPKNFKGESVSKTGIYYYYDIGTIIDFALTNKEITTGNNQYNYYRTARDYAINNGAKHYTAAECFNNENGASSTYVLDEKNNITLDILYNKYYFESSSDENNYSVCNMITYNDYHFMFTGDLEKDGEEEMVKYYDGSSIEKTLPKVELFKAGHHGSKTSSNDCLLSIIQPKICCVCCCAGTTEYTFDLPNTFPTQGFISRIAAYTDRVYVTSVIDEVQSRNKGELIHKSLNGTITISSNGSLIGVNATNNTTKLKDSDWFNGYVYVDSNNRLYASGDKKYNYYNENDEGVTKTVRRVWPEN